MTNAFAQNIENEKSNAVDLLLKTTINTQGTDFSSKKTSDFSNIMNNLDARTNRAKTDFEQKAKVTNTSSINKKALEKKSDSDIQKQKATVSNDVDKTNKKISDSKNEEKTLNKTTKHSEKNGNKIQKEDTQQKNEVIQKEENVEKKDNLSDINNSSPVDPSPVFSNDEIEIDNKLIQEDAIVIEDKINVMPLISEVDAANNVDLKEKINELIENIETLDEAVDIVENISSALDNSNLSGQEKEILQEAITELKNLIQNAQEEFSSVNFDELLAKLQEKIREMMNGLAIQISENIDATQIEKLNLVDSILSRVDIQNIKKQSDVIQTSKVSIDEISSAIEKAENFVKDIENALDGNDSEKLSNIKEDISSKLDEIKQAFIGKKDDTNALELDKKLKEAFDNLEKILSSKISNEEIENSLVEVKNLLNAFSKEDSKIIEVDFLKNSNVEIANELEAIDTKELLNSESIDSETMNQILNVLDKVENDVQIDEEIKIEAQKLVEKINNNQVSNNEIVEVLDELKQEIKISKEQNQEVENIDNTIDVANVFEKFSNNKENESNLKQNLNKEANVDYSKIQNKDEKTPNENIDLEISESDLETKELKLNAKISSDLKIDELEASLEKASEKSEMMNQMMDDLMVEVELKAISSQSGALSVADEVAKLAMGENSSLNPITSAHSSVTYDSASGISAVIKNAAQMMKTAQAQNPEAPSMNEILNQITNKLTQLKDNMGQKLTMVLRPNDLGRLSIELTSNNLGLTTQIMAQNDDVRAFIERNIDTLRQQLADAGVNVNNIQIKTAGQEGTSNYDGNQNFNREQQQESQNQQNSEQRQNNKRNQQETLAQMQNYDMFFAKDFTTVLNKTMNYSIN